MQIRPFSNSNSSSLQLIDSATTKTQFATVPWGYIEHDYTFCYVGKGDCFSDLNVIVV